MLNNILLSLSLLLVAPKSSDQCCKEEPAPPPPPPTVVPPGFVNCGGQMPASPQPGGYHVQRISVDDPNLGRVEREFSISLPTSYSNNVKTPLVLHFHGSGGSGTDGGDYLQWNTVSEEDVAAGGAGIMIVQGSGVDGFWNCSKTDGPLGAPCELPRPSGAPLASCGLAGCENYACDPQNSCDWRTCYDDVAFTRAMVDYMRNHYCVDIGSVHMSGSSNGGLFTYSALSQLNDVIASAGINCASPILGFGEVPLDPPVSIIDFHGLQDPTMPYDINSASAIGGGPHDTVKTGWYFYLEQKPNTKAKWATALDCTTEGSYPTAMDGVDGWACTSSSDCEDGTEFVSCTGNYDHGPAFKTHNPPIIGGTRILWDFMKSHSRAV